MNEGFIMGLQFAISCLETEPPAQQENILCKDCKHYKFANNRSFGMPIKFCEIFRFEDIDDFDFCSRAKRKENG